MQHEVLVGSAAAPEYAGLADLMAAVREVMEAGSGTTLGAEDLAGPTAELRRIAAELRTSMTPERVNKIRLMPEEIDRIRAGEPWQCFPFNAQGIPFAMTVTGEEARAEFTPGNLHEGPPNYLHGGFSAAMIDAFLGTLVQVATEPSFTATLDLRYLGPVALDVPCVLSGAITSRSGRKSIAECTISQHGTPLVAAKGLFVAVAGSGVSDLEQRVAELR